MKQIKIIFINNNKVLYFRVFSNNIFSICLQHALNYLNDKKEGRI